ncbi:hypothetical protein NQZ68_003683 [Dissostichus eleginoides]|nr:hypothetical protein NQZ68_003683 [Dissostichus eleginoides]
MRSREENSITFSASAEKGHGEEERLNNEKSVMRSSDLCGSDAEPGCPEERQR